MTPVLITIDPVRDRVETMAAPLGALHDRCIGSTGGPAALVVARDAFNVEFDHRTPARNQGRCPPGQRRHRCSNRWHNNGGPAPAGCRLVDAGAWLGPRMYVAGIMHGGGTIAAAHHGPPLALLPR